MNKPCLSLTLFLVAAFAIPIGPLASAGSISQVDTNSIPVGSKIVFDADVIIPANTVDFQVSETCSIHMNSISEQTRIIRAGRTFELNSPVQVDYACDIGGCDSMYKISLGDDSKPARKSFFDFLKVKKSPLLVLACRSDQDFYSISDFRIELSKFGARLELSPPVDFSRR